MAGKAVVEERVRGIAEVTGRAVRAWTTTRGRQDGDQAGGGSEFEEQQGRQGEHRGHGQQRGAVRIV